MNAQLEYLYQHIQVQKNYLNEHNWTLFHSQQDILSDGFKKLFQTSNSIKQIKQNGLLRTKFELICEQYNLLLERVYYVLKDVQQRHRQVSTCVKKISNYTQIP